MSSHGGGPGPARLASQGLCLVCLESKFTPLLSDLLSGRQRRDESSLAELLLSRLSGLSNDPFGKGKHSAGRSLHLVSRADRFTLRRE